ncbi:MAG: DUF86 domain-containing protein [Anaerolineae bacterium]|jgi:uncharacterized protein with HEPN domain
MSPSHHDILRHMLDEADFLLSQSASIDLEEFEQDGTLKRAFVRSLEIIGEAAGKLPDDLKQRHSQIDWRSMSAMRNRLIHGYFGVDYEIVWDVVVNKVPELRTIVLAMLDQLSRAQEVQSEAPSD